MSDEDKQGQHYLEKNRQAWNEAAVLHRRARRDPKNSHAIGQSTLAAVEREELGKVEGSSILHLQCNNGMDCLSLAQLGARVLGVDFSEVAIEEARMLAKESGIDARFICADIYEFTSDEKFDIVYTGKGAIYWLPNLNQWAKLVHSLLKPGGRLYIYEEHSLLPWLLELDPTNYNPATGTTNYFHKEEPQESVGLDYVGLSGEGVCPCYEWQWTLGDVVTSLAGANLSIDFLHEWPFLSGFKYWPYLEERDGAYHIPADRAQLPLSFSLQATR